MPGNIAESSPAPSPLTPRPRTGNGEAWPGRQMSAFHPGGSPERQVCLAAWLPLYPRRRGAPLPQLLASVLGALSPLPQAGPSLTCDRKAGGLCRLGRAALHTAPAEECFHRGGATHLFLPFVTHSSATRRRSETLRDRPSPVVPFTVPNKDSVSGTSRYLPLAHRRRWGAGSGSPAYRKRVQSGRGRCHVSMCTSDSVFFPTSPSQK